MLSEELKTFVVYVTALDTLLIEIIIYLLQTAQIIDIKLIQIAFLKENKALIKVLTKYLDFLNVFF